MPGSMSLDAMSDTPYREPLPGTRRLYMRFDADMTDEEIDAGAEEFVEALLGELPERAKGGARDSRAAGHPWLR